MTRFAQFALAAIGGLLVFAPAVQAQTTLRLSTYVNEVTPDTKVLKSLPNW